MDIGAKRSHWDVSVSEAKRVQDELVTKVSESPLAGPVQLIAGVDVSIKNRHGRAAIVVLEMFDWSVKCAAVAEQAITWPYVPGYLAFREVPIVLQAWRKLAVAPDVIMVDGHGRAHSRRFGLACHLGVLLQTPTLGVAKRRFVGTHRDPDTAKGSWTELTDPMTGELLGAIVRTRTNVNPVYVSTGHAITLEESIALTIQCAERYRIPEPTRQAHLESRRWGQGART